MFNTARAVASLTAATILGSHSIALAQDLVAAIDDLRNPNGSGGALITSAEVAAFAPDIELYPADEAIRGLAHSAHLRSEHAFESDAIYSQLQTALRYRVEGLAISTDKAPGVSFAREQFGTLISFDTRGVSYRQVEVVYTTDGWATSHGQMLSPIAPATLGTLLSLPWQGTLEYALRLVGHDGETVWLNNGRDLGVYGGQSWLNYRVDLASLAVRTATPTRPAFAQLVRSFADASSQGGVSVVHDELSTLVEQVTWEGGPGVHAWEAIVPALTELAFLLQEGVAFEPGAYENLSSFLQAQLNVYPRAHFPPLEYDRGEHGQLLLHAPLYGADEFTFVYSTDGWNSSRTAACMRDEAGFDCALGYIPKGTLLIYAFAYRTGSETTWHRVTNERNFFQAIPR